jgi:uncharacterized membrane protein YqgA involved in biofilm formation
MTGTLINAAAVVCGGAAGMIFGEKMMSKRYEAVYFQIVGLFTLMLGVRMGTQFSSPLLVALSLVAGGFVGTRLRLDEKTARIGEGLKKLTRSNNDRFTEGLVGGFLLFCMGSMSVVGAIEEGFGKTSDLLLAKSVMDFFSAMMLASALGAGVLFSALPLLLFQGGITALTYFAGASIPEIAVTEMTAAGGVMLAGLSLDLLKVKTIPVVNMLPALLLVCLFVWLRNFFPM